MMRFLKKTFRLGLWLSAAGALAYFLDPRNGRERRARAKDQAGAKLRRTGRDVEKKASYIQGKVEGAVSTVTSSSEPPADDKSLADRIKSEVLGGDRFEGHQVVVDAVDGVVALRGEVQQTEHIDELEKEVRKVPGVNDVENLLHLPGTPAPNKESSLGAS